MLEVVVAGQDRQTFKKIEHTLTQHPVEIIWAPNGSAALNRVSAAKGKNKPVDLVITDETLSDMTGRELVEQVIMTSPMTSCAPVSTLSADEFHETYEGFGVLMQLPPNPDAESGETLVAILKKLSLL